MSNDVICPKCKSDRIAKIRYGRPTAFVEPDYDYILGGCNVKFDSNGNPTPYYFCRDCEHKFDKEVV